jgi:hypothetical protein
VLEVLPGVAWIILGLFIHLARPKHVRFAKTAIAGITLTLTAFLGVVHIVATHGMSFDVLFLHREAAHALTQGLNPYTDAVSVPNGAPTAAPDEMITGYVYPPIPLLFYSIGEWVFSDARYVSLLAFLMFLGVIAIQAVRRPGKGGVLTLLLMASIPGWPLVLRAAWIEPLTLALAAAAFAFWARPVLSSVFLGMTLASKQYFAVTSPLLAVFRGRYWVTSRCSDVGQRPHLECWCLLGVGRGLSHGDWFSGRQCESRRVARQFRNRLGSTVLGATSDGIGWRVLGRISNES